MAAVERRESDLVAVGDARDQIGVAQRRQRRACVESKFCMVEKKYARGERKVRIARAWRDNGA